MNAITLGHTYTFLTDSSKPDKMGDHVTTDGNFHPQRLLALFASFPVCGSLIEVYAGPARSFLLHLPTR